MNSIVDDMARAGKEPDPLLDCLVTLTVLHQRPMSAEALLAGQPITPGKMSAEIFSRAAHRAGLSARLVRRNLGAISPLALPAVALLNDGGACVLTGLDDREAKVIHPETGMGVRSVSIDELDQHYSGWVFFSQPLFRLDERADEHKVTTSPSWFWGNLLSFRKEYIDVALASVLINLFALASPLFTMNVYDRVVPNNAKETLWVLAIGVGIVFFFDFLMRMLRGYFLDVAGKKMDVLLSSLLFQQVMGIRLAGRPASAGAFANNLKEFETLRDFFTSATLTAVIDLPFVIIFLAVIFMIGGPLGWVPLLAVPFVVLSGLLLQAPLNAVIQENFKEAAQKHGILVEAISGLESIKGAGGEGRMQAIWEHLVNLTSRSGLKSRLYSSLAVNFTNTVQQAVTVVMVVYGVYIIADGELTTGGLIACTILAGRVLAPLGLVAGLMVRYQHTKMALKGLNGIMKLAVERPHDKTFLHRPVLRGEIEFCNVTFNYPEQKSAALENVSFKIGAGERVAFLGKIGSGKSTIEKLIMGFYQPTSGTILVDGVDINQIDPVNLRRNISYVPQDIQLFYGTVKDNITLGMPYASDAEVLRAAQIAGVDKFTNRHPMGFDMPVGENGFGLSGGQRQSIACARGLVNDAPIIVLDEPTSSMDNVSESAFLQALIDSADGKTLLLVTHKMSMMPMVTRLIVIDGGRVVADGPRDAVLQTLSRGMQTPAVQQSQGGEQA